MQAIFIFLIFQILLLPQTFSHELMMGSELNIREGIVYRGESVKPFTGAMYQADDEKNIYILVTYKDGILHGLGETYWNREGDIKMRGFFANGKKTGTYETFDRNGRLRDRETFLNDLQNGLCEHFDENGQLRLIENFENDVQQGLELLFHENV